MQIKPCKCEFTDEIFCLVRLEENETKEDILKNEEKIREMCLKLCVNEDQAITVSDFPITVSGKPCGYWVVEFLNV